MKTINKFFMKTLIVKLSHYKAIILSLMLMPAALKPEETHQQPETWITVFVHGIMSVQPHLSLGNIIRLMNDCVENSFYSHTVYNIRTDTLFHRNQAMQGLGLLPIDKESTYAGDASCALATLFDQVYSWTNGSNPNNNYYYTYGWSGLLSPSIRLREAKEFYVALSHEIQRFRDQGIEPKIRIVGYSHGGNVVLGLAAGRQEGLSEYPFTIDETILLGVPVQLDTDIFLNDPIFKKIYHFYSLSDRIQAIDCFSYKRLFSRKIFTKRRGFELPDNLIQIELRLMRNTTSKRYIPKAIDLRYNFDNRAIIAGHSPLLRNSSPGHCELWFFGWTHAHYRNQFPLSPLPIVAIMPFVLEKVKEYEYLYTPTCHMVADIRPEQEVLIVRRKNDPCSKHVIDFLTLDQLEQLKDKSREFSFKRVTYEDYNERIKAAFERTERYFSHCNDCGCYHR